MHFSQIVATNLAALSIYRSKSTIGLLMSSRGKVFYWLWYHVRRLAPSDMNEICASI
jgi:hypothetical protein